VMAPPAARHDHHDGDHGADHDRCGERPERLGNADPGAHPGEQFDVAGAHPADGVGRQEQAEPDGGSPQARGQTAPAERDAAGGPARKDHRESDPVGDFQLPTVDHGGQDQDRADQAPHRPGENGIF